MAHIAHLGGALIGFYYAKFLGLGGKTPSIAVLRSERWKNESSLPNQPKRKGWTSKFSKDKIVEVKRAEIKKKELSVELDEILDKISAHGMHSLTDAEKAILEKGSKDLAERAK